MLGVALDVLVVMQPIHEQQPDRPIPSYLVGLLPDGNHDAIKHVPLLHVRNEGFPRRLTLFQSALCPDYPLVRVYSVDLHASRDPSCQHQRRTTTVTPHLDYWIGNLHCEHGEVERA